MSHESLNTVTPDSEIKSILLTFFLTILVMTVLAALGWVGARHAPGELIAYKSAQQIFFSGMNPYSESKMLEMQRNWDRSREIPMMIWNPPMIFLYPGLILMLPAPILAITWPVLETVAALVLALVGYRLASAHWPSPYALVASSFICLPFWFELSLGQISSVVAAPVVCGLFLFQKRQDFWAGVFCGFFFVKPHLFLLPLSLMLYQVIYGRRWRVMLGSATTILFFAATVEFLHQGIWG